MLYGIQYIVYTVYTVCYNGIAVTLQTEARKQAEKVAH